ncbi:acyltransferase domain-containing protein [Streptomyces sp. CY1]|uniref:acyltransferase domain-containing protein n=1 Tax=Streptomyces sp. CY1 TaxID=3388313 RepID=UPI0039A382EA
MACVLRRWWVIARVRSRRLWWAGALSLEDGAKVVALRSKALRRLAGGGAMASLGVGEERAGALLSGLGDQAGGVGVAAVNGPSSTVVSGPPQRVAAVVAACQEAGGACAVD